MFTYSITILSIFILCSEVPGTAGHVTDIRETPQDGTAAQVSVLCTSVNENNVSNLLVAISILSHFW